MNADSKDSRTLVNNSSNSISKNIETKNMVNQNTNNFSKSTVDSRKNSIKSVGNDEVYQNVSNGHTMVVLY